MHHTCAVRSWAFVVALLLAAWALPHLYPQDAPAADKQVGEAATVLIYNRAPWG